MTSEPMELRLPWLGLLSAILAVSCDDTRPVYPLGSAETAGESGAGQGGEAGTGGATPEAGQSAGGAGGRTADAS